MKTTKSNGHNVSTFSVGSNAHALDQTVRNASKEVANELGLHRFDKITREVLEDYGIFQGFSPDGGVFAFERNGKKYLIAFEAKVNGIGGTALDRFYKNLRFINKIAKISEVDVVRYVCFGSGAGFDITKNHGPMQLVNTTLDDNVGNKAINTVNKTGVSWFVSTKVPSKQFVKEQIAKALKSN